MDEEKTLPNVQIPIQTPPPVGAQVPSQAQMSPELEELIKLLTELFAKASELGLACIEIGEEDIKKNPDLRDLRESCLDVTRTVRRIVKVSRKLQR
ncbi:MAG: hypothetical protein DSO07_05170 [Thermoproteota archaeon]|nr:MAG: hypothetical protein DSO07_05170 [Candidatus Korarchaeota archaeon]